jgi:hypothetical protein
MNWQLLLTNPVEADGNWSISITNLFWPGQFYRAAGQ